MLFPRKKAPFLSIYRSGFFFLFEQMCLFTPWRASLHNMEDLIQIKTGMEKIEGKIQSIEFPSIYTNRWDR